MFKKIRSFKRDVKILVPRGFFEKNYLEYI